MKKKVASGRTYDAPKVENFDTSDNMINVSVILSGEVGIWRTCDSLPDLEGD